MIADRLTNRILYRKVSEDIALGLKHLAGLNEQIDLGSYLLSDRVRVVVSSYKTDGPSFEGYEAHKKFIDIQYPIQGREKVLWSPLEGMVPTRQYDSVKDRAIWDQPVQETSIITGEGVFAVFFPEDAHRPCLPVRDPEVIKKITLKISVDAF